MVHRTSEPDVILFGFDFEGRSWRGPQKSSLTKVMLNKCYTHLSLNSGAQKATKPNNLCHPSQLQPTGSPLAPTFANLLLAQASWRQRPGASALAGLPAPPLKSWGTTCTPGNRATPQKTIQVEADTGIMKEQRPQSLLVCVSYHRDVSTQTSIRQLTGSNLGYDKLVTHVLL